MIQRSPQSPMIFIFQCDEAKRLEHMVHHLQRGAQYFSHAVHRPCLRLEGDFDEVALSQGMCQAQQSTGGGDGLKFSFGAAAVF